MVISPDYTYEMPNNLNKDNPGSCFYRKPISGVKDPNDRLRFNSINWNDPDQVLEVDDDADAQPLAPPPRSQCRSNTQPPYASATVTPSTTARKAKA